MTETSTTPRKLEGIHRRVSLYVSWNLSAEAGRELCELNNRYSSMLEVRRVAYPKYEWVMGRVD
jgi:hypothetical protein